VRTVHTLLVAAAVGACGAAAAPAAAQEAGQALFEGKGVCFSCHGKGGVGTPLAPPFTDAEWLHFEARPTAEQIVDLVKEGVARPLRFPAPMPPRGGSSLSDEELAEVARYVLSLSAEGDGGR
jgi:mono/diheme cytochrome c family protein